ncbi:histidine kinase [Amycolatopsis mediterranei]|uniref:sensor histidine kinase n=1 Tax=Amycolatopsis mediterranei TaxID=33910 RepID=UPI0034374EBA
MGAARESIPGSSFVLRPDAGGPTDARSPVFQVESRARGLLLLLGVSSAATSVVLEPSARDYPAIAVLEVLVIVGFATAGHLLLQDPTQRENGRLLIASALLQVVTHLHLVDHSPLPMLAWLCGPLSAMPAAIVLLRFPDKELDPLDRGWVVFHLAWLVSSRLLFTIPTPERRLGWWPAIPMSPGFAAAASIVGNTVLSLSTVFFAFLLFRRLRHSRGLAGHAVVPVLVASISASVTVVLHLMSVANSRESVPPLVLGIEQAGLLTIPAAFIFSAIAMRLARAKIADQLLKVNHSTTPREWQLALSETFADPDLKLLCWHPREAVWMTVDGDIVDLDAFRGRLVFPVDAGGDRLASIVADHAIGRHKHLLDAAEAATRITLLNIAALAEVRESRFRILQASVDERRRLGRNLHDGVQPRMAAVTMLVEQLWAAAEDGSRTRELAEELKTAVKETLDDLRDFARGLHPTVLTHRGLAAAVESAAGRLRLTVSIAIPGERWPEPVEVTAYYFITEGLNNVAKHADVDRAEVRVTNGGDCLVVEVIDCGQGGADPNSGSGSGLVGLKDRVGAVGGIVEINSKKEGGTCLRARLPFASR